MKQFTLLLELCQKTQKPLQSRDKEKSNPGKMKIRGTGGVVKNDGLWKEKFKRMFFLSVLLYRSFAILRPPHENRGGLTYGG